MDKFSHPKDVWSMYMLFLPNAIHLYIIKINLFSNLGELINGCTKKNWKELV